MCSLPAGIPLRPYRRGEIHQVKSYIISFTKIKDNRKGQVKEQGDEGGRWTLGSEAD